MSDEHPKPKHPKPGERVVYYGQQSPSTTPDSGAAAEQDDHKRPPRKWEMWVAIFFIVIAMSNWSQAADTANQADPINAVFFLGGIGWLVAVWVRLRNYKRSRGDQP